MLSLVRDWSKYIMLCLLEQLVSADKHLSIFSYQIEAIVYLYIYIFLPHVENCELLCML